MKSYDRPLILYHCGHEKCKPSHSYGPAIRPHYLLHYILHGQGSYSVNGKTYSLKGGEAFLIYPGVTSIYSADEQDPWEYCWIGFDGSEVHSLLQACGFSLNNHICTDHSNNLLWDEFMRLIDYFNEKKGNEFTLLSQLYLCFSYLCVPNIFSSKEIHELHIEKAMDYIHNSYTYDIKIADIANYLHIDRTYLYKLFMTYIETSPQHYLIRYRIDISKKMLRETHLSITEIAYSCGFRDASSFNKHFRNLVGMTPTQYKKSNSKPQSY